MSEEFHFEQYVHSLFFAAAFKIISAACSFHVYCFFYPEQMPLWLVQLEKEFP
jgi:hypothetical protein